MCSIAPVFVLNCWNVVRHRDDAIVAEVAPARRSQPGVLTGKRLHRRFVKSRARHRAAWTGRSQTGVAMKKSFVRQKDCADEARCLSRGREKRRGRELQDGSWRRCAVIQRPGLREPITLAYASLAGAAASPRLSRSRARPARWHGSGPARGEVRGNGRPPGSGGLVRRPCSGRFGFGDVGRDRVHQRR